MRDFVKYGDDRGPGTLLGLYGRLNSPIQLAAAHEMAKAKGGNVPNVSRLGSGEFCFAAESAAARKVRTPLSLSYHPRGPLTVEEVVAHAMVKRDASRTDAPGSNPADIGENPDTGSSPCPVAYSV